MIELNPQQGDIVLIQGKGRWIDLTMLVNRTGARIVQRHNAGAVSAFAEFGADERWN